MMLEYDIRISLKPISIATLSSAPWMTLAVIGSTRLRRPAPLPSALRARRVVVITLLPPSDGDCRPHTRSMVQDALTSKESARFIADDDSDRSLGRRGRLRAV